MHGVNECVFCIIHKYLRYCIHQSIILFYFIQISPLDFINYFPWFCSILSHTLSLSCMIYDIFDWPKITIEFIIPFNGLKKQFQRFDEVTKVFYIFHININILAAIHQKNWLRDKRLRLLVVIGLLCEMSSYMSNDSLTYVCMGLMSEMCIEKKQCDVMGECDYLWHLYFITLCATLVLSYGKQALKRWMRSLA